MTGPLIECVPNFSEGRDLAVVMALEAAIGGVPGALLLDHTSDPDHHRSVITFAGTPEVVTESAVRAAAEAAKHIDLNRHQGVHPRLGALDVLPFVPLGDATLADCAAVAHTTGERIWEELRIPVYFYGAAALRPERVPLEKVRHGGFEALRDAVLIDETKAPDLGGPGLHPTAGAVAIGARKILIAFNVNLKSNDLAIAKDIARRIRSSGGGLPGVKALGLRLASRGLVQVSMNLTDFEQTPPHVVFAEVSRLAGEHHVEIAESELVGLMPRRAVEMAFAHFLKLPGFKSNSVIEDRIEAATP